MTIYIDNDFKCYTQNASGRMPVETEIFDGKCRTFIEGYRFVPQGETWTREDGTVFTGEMVSPCKDYSILAIAQEAYDEAQAHTDEMLTAIEEALGL